MGQRGQSEAVGVALLTAVVIIAVSGIGVAVLSGQDSGGTVLVDVGYTVDSDNLTLTHQGGDAVAAGDVDVVLDNGTRVTYALSSFTPLGSTDSVFDPGERWRHDYDSPPGTTVRILVVHRASNTVLLDESTAVPTATATPVPTATKTPTPAGTPTVTPTPTATPVPTATPTPTPEPNDSPSASFGYDPSSPETGDSITFDGSGSTDSDGTVEKYAWDWDDDGNYEVTAGDPTASHSYASSGEKTVTLRVTDDDGDTSTTSRTVGVNEAPTAAFSYSPTDPTTDDTVTFDAGGSSDSDGRITAYEWDFDGDGTIDATGQQVTENYPQAGAYEVNLTVTDDKGATDSRQQTVSVGPNGSVLVVPTSGEAGLTVNGLGLVDRDPSAAYVDFSTVARSSYGGNQDVSANDTVRDGGRTLVLGNNTWKKVDYSYEMTDETVVAFGFRSGAEGEIHGLGLEADNGQSNDRIYEVYGTQNWGIQPSSSYDSAAPDWKRYRIPAGQDYRISAQYLAFVTDDDADADAESLYRDVMVYDDDTATYSYEWDFDGDGAVDVTGKQPQYTYSSAGTYTVTLTITGPDGATTSLTETVSVSNPNQSPSASFDYRPSSPETGESITFDGSGSSDSDGSIDEYAWDWDDDGTYEATSNSPTTSHGYRSSGTKTVTLRVTDDDGATETTTRTVDVAEPLTASLTHSPSSTTTAETVTFDASNSADPDGSIRSYEFRLDDGRTVTQSSPTFSYTYDCSGSYTVEVTVTGSDGETATAQTTVTVQDAERDVVAAINSGGSAYTSCEGIDYEADTGGTTYSSTDPIAGTSDDSLYQTERYDTDRVKYAVPVSDGRYRVTFKLAEIYFTDGDTDARVFNLTAEGTRVEGDVNINREVGPNTRLDVTTTVTVTDGTLNVAAVDGEEENPKLSAVLVERLPSATWTAAADWDGAVAAESVVHDDLGDRRADAVELGYPASDRGGDGLLTYWSFDGDATDESGNGHDGTVTGATVSGTGIAGSRSLAFDGSEDIVADDDAEAYLNGKDELTVSAWVRSDVTDTDRGILIGQQPDGTDRPLSLRHDSEGFEDGCSNCLKAGVSVDGTEAVYESADDTQTTGWQHVVVTWQSGEPIRLYRNGTADTPTFQEARTGSISNVETLLVGQGAKDSGTADGWDGNIDEVRIYDRQLSASEAKVLSDVGREGTIRTGTKTLSTAVSPVDLRLRNVTATRPAGTGIDVVVHSDPDGDGVFEESSSPITLDGSDDYDITGLQRDSRRFRLAVTLRTDTPTRSPTVDTLEVGT